MEKSDICILVVDDEVEIAEGCREFFELEDFTVLTAYNVKDALALFNENQDKISLILSDIRMPGQTGIDFADEIRKINPVTPIFCLFSGQIDKDNKLSHEELQNLGVKKFYKKPMDLGDISDDILNWFNAS